MVPSPHMASNIPGLPMAASGSALTPDLETAPRQFRTDMPDEWAKVWNESEREGNERWEAAKMKKRNELTIARQVVIQLWHEVRTASNLF